MSDEQNCWIPMQGDYKWIDYDLAKAFKERCEELKINNMNEENELLELDEFAKNIEVFEPEVLTNEKPRN